MTKNMGTVDRVLRAILGVALLAAAFLAPQLSAGWPHWVAIAVGAVMLFTAVVSICPAYLPFGIRTCRNS